MQYVICTFSWEIYGSSNPVTHPSVLALLLDVRSQSKTILAIPTEEVLSRHQGELEENPFPYSLTSLCPWTCELTKAPRMLAVIGR